MQLIDENNPLPLYHQLQEILREKVVSGEWLPESQIPTEIQLMEMFGVSSSTVRSAILELVRTGFLHRKRGRGTFVSRPKLETDFTKEFFPVSSEARHAILKATVIEPNKTIRRMLDLAPGQTVTELIRLRFIEDEPASVERSYVPSHFCPELASANVTGRIVDWIKEKLGITIARVKIYLEAGVTNKYESNVLQMKNGSPTLLFTRICYDSQDRPLMVMKSILRGDRIRVVTDSDLTGIQLEEKG